jgi:hypothetical protein
MEISKIQSVTLDDLITIRKDFTKSLMRYVNAYAKIKETREVSARQKPDERLNQVESILESILFTDTDYEKMADNFREGQEAMDGIMMVTDPNQEAMRDFDGFQMAQNDEFTLPVPDRLAMNVIAEIEGSKSRIKTPMKGRSRRGFY